MSLLRRRRRIHPFPFDESNKNSKPRKEEDDNGDFHSDEKKGNFAYKHEENKSAAPKRSCLDTWCWLFGCMCVTWWLILFLHNVMPASFPKYVTEVITGPVPDPPGVKLRKLGLKAKHPVVFVPAEVTGGLELWEGRKCAQGLFRKRIWSGTFSEVYKRPKCWVEHMSLDDETGLDPCGIRVRPVSGLVSADDFGSGYFVWETLVYNLASIGYEGKTMFMAAYDWRLSFQNTEVRDQTLNRMKHNIELMVATSGGQKAVIIPHSMGALYFLHFMKWVETPAPMGGGGGPDWCSKHIKAVVNVAAPFLGVPKAIPLLLSAEAKDIAISSAIAPSFIERDIFQLQTLQHVMKLSRSWDSIMSLIPRGGDTIWGGLDWSPEEGYSCGRQKGERKNGTQIMDRAGSTIYQTRCANYGRIISFGKDVAEAPSYDVERIDFKGAAKGHGAANRTRRDSWTEYQGMGFGDIKAVADYKTYTAESIVDLLHFVAPKIMARGTAHFSYGIADHLDDPKYKHHKYWSNPLETTLPNAPDMEIFSLYGVGLPTERAYVYKLSPAASECNIPFRIDSSADDKDTCLKDGVYSVDGDETVPVISAGFMCAKAWHGKTRFNPSGARTFIREYRHSPPTTLLEGRGTLSGGHVDIMGNFALIEDVLRIAAGASGEELGGNRVHSDIFKWSEKINLQL